MAFSPPVEIRMHLFHVEAASSNLEHDWVSQLWQYNILSYKNQPTQYIYLFICDNRMYKMHLLYFLKVIVFMFSFLFWLQLILENRKEQQY